ncbi:MAG: DNA polymerase IV [Chloroflexota bacterium]|nr:MAG: DNA polymerase IV [Chloroflexota bacterium]
MPRKILHLDLDAFFCAVEEQRDPSLRGKAFAVGGRPETRGVVASCSYAARRFGIRSAMPMARAVKLCPHLIIVSAHFDAYQAASQQVMARLHQLTALVEQLSIDEAFLDVSDLPEPAELLARRLQATINADLDLPCSLGVASNKLVAKIANDVGKAAARSDQPPNALQVVPPGQEAAFLAPLPVEALWGVGPKTTERLHGLGLRTIGDLARWPEADLMRRFGQHGHDLARHSWGIDERPVVTEHEAKSISQETTFARDITDGSTLQETLRHQSEQVGYRLRRKGLNGTTVKLKLRWADFTTLTRQVTLEQPTNLDDDIYAAALQLFEKTWPPGKRVRLIGVGVSGFETAAYQLELWSDPQLAQTRRLQSVLDELRERFGRQAIQRGSHLLRDELEGE